MCFFFFVSRKSLFRSVKILRFVCRNEDTNFLPDSILFEQIFGILNAFFEKKLFGFFSNRSFGE